MRNLLSTVLAVLALAGSTSGYGMYNLFDTDPYTDLRFMYQTATQVLDSTSPVHQSSVTGSDTTKFNPRTKSTGITAPDGGYMIQTWVKLDVGRRVTEGYVLTCGLLDKQFMFKFVAGGTRLAVQSDTVLFPKPGQPPVVTFQLIERVESDTVPNLYDGRWHFLAVSINTRVTPALASFYCDNRKAGSYPIIHAPVLPKAGTLWAVNLYYMGPSTYFNLAYGWMADLEARWQCRSDKYLSDYFKFWADTVGFKYPAAAERQPVGPVLALTARPNPAGGPVTFGLGPTTGRASLGIYDLGGRLVEQLYDGPGRPGQALEWPGTTCASGTYLAVLRQGQARQTLRLVIRR